MNVAYHAVNLELRPEEREGIERELGRVVEFVKNFPRPTYHVEVERSARKGGIGVSLYVNLSTRSLFATAWGSDLRSSMELAVDRVVRQAKKHLDRLRKDERAGAATHRRETAFTEPTVADLESIRDLEDFQDQIAHHSARLHTFLRREYKLIRKAEGSPHWISIPDVVEDAIAYVFEHFAEKPKELSPDRWLIRRGLLILHEEMERAEATPDETGPEAANYEALEDWEDLMGLALPDAAPMDHRVADEATASPELLGDRRKAQNETAAALAELPTMQRRSIVLHHLEGYQLPEIAYVLNTDETQVRGWLDAAEEELRRRLDSWRRL